LADFEKNGVPDLPYPVPNNGVTNTPTMVNRADDPTPILSHVSDGEPSSSGGDINTATADGDIMLPECPMLHTYSTKIGNLMAECGMPKIADNQIKPSPSTPCDCRSPRSLGSSKSSKNLWRESNSVLTQTVPYQQYTWTSDDSADDDAIIHVLLEGWEAAANNYQISPLLAKLRGIDELQFSSCRDIERLAILRTMHLLLRYHVEPTPERYITIPPWYLNRSVVIGVSSLNVQLTFARPSQNLPHSYAIDFFVWYGFSDSNYPIRIEDSLNFTEPGLVSASDSSSVNIDTAPTSFGSSLRQGFKSCFLSSFVTAINEIPTLAS
jgi:hypothetical protein